MQIPRSLGAALLATALATTTAAAQTPSVRAAAPALAPTAAAWAIDVAHSELSFRIRHLMGRVRGTFTTWSGSIVADTADWARSTVSVTIQAGSIDTGHERRDAHLRSGDFFAVDSFPTITFTSTSVERRGDAIRVAGLLTMRGQTRPVVLDGQLLGAGRDAQGKARVSVEATTTIDRKAFGVSWNRTLDTGTLLGDEVEITIAVQAVRQ